MVESLRGKKMIHVAVGALHCLAVTDQGQVKPASFEFTNVKLLSENF